MGVLCFIYLICALRTNIVFVIIFITLCLGFLLNAGYYWQMALGHIALASRLQIVSLSGLSSRLISDGPQREGKFHVNVLDSSSGGRRHLLHVVYSRMVDFLRSTAAGRRLSTSNSGWRYQPSDSWRDSEGSRVYRLRKLRIRFIEKNVGAGFGCDRGG